MHTRCGYIVLIDLEYSNPLLKSFEPLAVGSSPYSIFFPFFILELAYDLDTDNIPSKKQLWDQKSKEVSVIHNLGTGVVMPGLDLLGSLLTVLLLLLAK